MQHAQHLEELALNAWPGLQTIVVDGWIARLSQGYTKRANSVTPLYPGRRPLADKLSQCEALFRQAGLPLLFRLPSFATDTPELDAILSARQFRRMEETLVKRLDLQHVTASWSSRSILSADTALDAWLQRYHRFSGSSPHPTHRQIISLISGERACLTLMHNGNAVACGLGVVAGDHLGIFDIATHPDYRRHGFGREVTQSLLAWGRDHGATHAYLQVVAANVRALPLYDQLGFEEVYRYWYRLAPGDTV